MKPIPILLALVVVLGFVREAGAEIDYSELPPIPPPNMPGTADYSIQFGKRWLGFSDWRRAFETKEHTAMHLGPFGSYDVPLTATQGFVGSILIVVGILALVSVGTFRWKRKRTSP
jgi:hypothetical protein